MAVDCLKEHMRATVRLRELKLERLDLTRSIYDDFATIARHDGDEDLAQMLLQHGAEHLKALEQLAENEYQSRLRYYALCFTLADGESDLKAKDMIARIESMVLEAAVAA
jgi:hypothetical protein